MINSGAMRERVTIQKPVEQQSAFGETTLDWVDEATVYASVMGVRASDYFAAQQAGVLVTHRIRIRFFPTITHEHRLIWRGRVMEISSVLEREARSIHEILAREKAI
jgi:SPP1 family predicted phage head-tail adaptor